ncbi:N-acetyl-alpha-D-glucosaminyl L-malate synthase BshA [candidate division KSB1 bacterium]|nr:N-acetyl-alpha-D-glucosaminyl L-malate synthase BshA [candidate division KSB1 bacterium]
MNIAMVCYPTHGGSGVVATELGIGLARLGHKVHFISYSSPFRLRDFQSNVYFHEVDVSAYPLFKYPPYDLSLAAKIVQVAHSTPLDIVHAHYAIPHAVSAYLAKQMMRGQGPRIVTTLHGTDITLVGKDPSFYEAVKFSIEESDGVTAVSSYLRRQTIDEFHIEREIRVLSNFIDTERFNGVVTRCSKNQFAPNGEFLLMHTSNFRPVKRMPDTIRILEKIRKKVPAKLLLVGDGPDRQTAVDLARKLDVQEHVIYLGTQDYIENLLGCADLFLLPSEEESFGLAALEAMSSRTPVIASDIGGLPEVVENGKTGFLLPAGDIDGMAQAAIRLLMNPAQLREFGENGRKAALEYFEQDLIIPQYESYYQEILGSS